MSFASFKALALLGTLSLALISPAQSKESTPVVVEFPNTNILKAIVYADSSSIRAANLAYYFTDKSLALLSYLPTDVLDYNNLEIEDDDLYIFDRAEGRKLKLSMKLFRKINRYPLHSYLQKITTCVAKGYSQDPGVIFVKSLSPKYLKRIFGRDYVKKLDSCNAPTIENYLRLLADQGLVE